MTHAQRELLRQTSMQLKQEASRWDTPEHVANLLFDNARHIDSVLGEADAHST